jgi:hypothetical protein
MVQKIEPQNINRQQAASSATASSQWQNSIKPQKTPKISFADLSKAHKVSDTDRIKALTQYSVEHYWPIYKKRYPEAFANNPRLKSSTPEIIYLHTPAELKKISDLKPEYTLAFVQAANPNKIYTYVPTSIIDMKKKGANEVIATATHELMHSITNAFIRRTDNDTTIGKKETHRGAGNQLNTKITLPLNKNKGEENEFTIQTMLIEGIAELLSTSVTNINSKSVSYRPIRELSKKLIDIVGMDTYKKALIANNPKAYQTVIKAALILKQKYDVSKN